MPTHYTTCSLCEASCGVIVQTEAGRVTEIRGDPDDPLSRGHLCPKATALGDLQTDPDRLRHPVKRTPDGFVRCSWDEALSATVGEIHRIQREHGRDAVGIYLGNPNVHNLGAMLYGPLWIRTLRSRNTYSATSVDQLPQMLAAAEMFGHQLLFPVPDLDRTDLLVILGANPLVSNGSLMTAPGMRRRMREIQERGGRIVTVDPRRTETAHKSDTHLFIRPGTDALFLMAMLEVVFRLRTPDLGHLAAATDGLDALRTLAADFAPEVVADATGIAAAEIERIALALADTPRAVLYARFGVCTQAFGGVASWLVNAVNAVTGHLDTPGGLMFTQPAFDALYPPAGAPGVGRRDRWQSRVRGLPEFGGELPVAALAEEMLTPGEGQIRGMVVWAGNPVLSTPNGQQLDRGFEGLEFCVAVDFYINETSRHADYILPPAPPLSRDHFDLVFHLLAVRNTVKYSPAVFGLEDEVRHDWQILLALKDGLERARGGPSLASRAANRALQALGPAGLVDAGLRLGPHGIRRGVRAGLSVRKLKARPHGVDLGPLAACLLQRLPPGRTRIDLAPALYRADVPRLREHLASDQAGLVLIGRRQLRSNNSWLHNVERMVKGKPRCTLLIHPDDAAARGIADGQCVAVTSRTGRVEVAVEVTDAIMAGVVSLPHGWGHGRKGVQLRVASAHAGVSVNDLTDDQRVDPLSGNAALSAVPVEVALLSP